MKGLFLELLLFLLRFHEGFFVKLVNIPKWWLVSTTQVSVINYYIKCTVLRYKKIPMSKYI